MELITIKTFDNSIDAHLLKIELENEGIECYIYDEHTVTVFPLYSNAVGGIKLYVKNEDAEMAKQILSQISEYSLDDNNQLIKCPNCGAEQIEMMTSIKDIKSLISFIFSVLIFLIPFHTKHKYKCNNCKFEFN